MSKSELRRVVGASNSEFGSVPIRRFWPHADLAKAWADNGYLHVPAHDKPDCETCLKYGWEGTAHRLYPKMSAIVPPKDTLAGVRVERNAAGQWEWVITTTSR